MVLTFQVRFRSHPCDLVYSVKFSITCDSDRGECLIRGEGLSLRKKAFRGGGRWRCQTFLTVEFLIRASRGVVEECFRFVKRQ